MLYLFTLAESVCVCVCVSATLSLVRSVEFARPTVHFPFPPPGGRVGQSAATMLPYLNNDFISSRQTILRNRQCRARGVRANAAGRRVSFRLVSVHAKVRARRHRIITQRSLRSHQQQHF